MTYEESAALMTDPAFHGRIKVAALQAATYYQGEDAATPGHNSRYKWAQQCFSSPENTASQLQPTVVMDSNVQTAGAAITDTGLQTAVETTLEKMI